MGKACQISRLIICKLNKQLQEKIQYLWCFDIKSTIRKIHEYNTQDAMVLQYLVED